MLWIPCSPSSRASYATDKKEATKNILRPKRLVYQLCVSQKPCNLVYKCRVFEAPPTSQSQRSGLPLCTFRPEHRKGMESKHKGEITLDEAQSWRGDLVSEIYQWNTIPPKKSGHECCLLVSRYFSSSVREIDIQTFPPWLLQSDKSRLPQSHWSHLAIKIHLSYPGCLNKLQPIFLTAYFPDMYIHTDARFLTRRRIFSEAHIAVRTKNNTATPYKETLNFVFHVKNCREREHRSFAFCTHQKRKLHNKVFLTYRCRESVLGNSSPGPCGARGPKPDVTSQIQGVTACVSGVTSQIPVATSQIWDARLVLRSLLQFLQTIVFFLSVYTTRTVFNTKKSFPHQVTSAFSLRDGNGEYT